MFTSNKVEKKIHPPHYVKIEKTIHLYFSSHDLFKESCDLLIISTPYDRLKLPPKYMYNFSIF